MRYVGRFAPSPTGPLHLGSLVAAIASYLHARQAGGEWLVRIEDIDPPREIPGASDRILRTLEAFDLAWDGAVLRQSSRVAAYREVVAELVTKGLAFHCRCSRSELRATEGGNARYPGICRARQLPAGDAAVRVKVDPGVIAFTDGLQGDQTIELAAATGDYVIERRDSLPAYHLAVVLDDALQGITTIVRGVDLLESTFVHIHLQRLLGLPTPRYSHLPVVVNDNGQKLSKQSGAPAVASPDAATVSRMLRLLGIEAPAEVLRERPREVWRWAIDHWSIDRLRGLKAIRVNAS